MQTKKELNKGLLDLINSGQPDPFVAEYGSIREYYLSDSIGSASDYINWFHEIRNCRQTDMVKIHINCPGGDLFTTIQFLQAISECQGHVVASVEGMCMSAATLIFLRADECMITNHSMFLFHNYSSGTFGKGGEMYHGIIHEREWSEQLMRDIYEDFLTEEEIGSLINDKDIWMNAQQVMERLEKRGKIAERKQKKASSKKIKEA